MFILQKDLNNNINIRKLTFISCKIVKKSLYKLLNKKITIKKPNDLLINKKKVCGILQEVVKFEKRSFLIIGIGINTLTCPATNKFNSISLLECSNKLINNSKILRDIKNNYESIFYKYKFHENLLKKAL